MADSKITALASIGTGTDPANDPLVIVDVSDVSPGGMSATGTTKKVTLNNLLSSSPTATGNFTITGDLTVRTNKLAVTSTGVGCGTTTPATSLEVWKDLIRVTSDVTSGVYGTQFWRSGVERGRYGFDFSASLLETQSDGDTRFLTGGETERYRIDSTGIATWSNVGGGAGTAMTLNATGLGVGASPSFKFHVQQTLAGTASAVNPLAYIVNNGSGNTAKLTLSDAVTTDGNITLTGSATAANRLLGFGINGVQQMVLDGTGNVGIGVQPSYKLDVRGSDNSVIAQFGGTNRQVRLSTSAISAVDNASFNFIHTSGSGRFTFQNNSGTQTMLTIDDNGNNILRMPVTPPTLGVNLEGTFNLTSNTNLRISVRGSDGVTRTANITLA